MSKKISVYLPGGGTTATWQIGYLAALQEKGYKIENFVSSSAGTVSALFYIASEIKSVSIKELVDEIDGKLKNSKLLDYKHWVREIFKAILYKDIKEFHLWSRENYKKSLAEIFTIENEGRKRMLRLKDIPKNFNLALQFSEFLLLGDTKLPLLIPLDISKAMDVEFGTFASISMSFPGLLPESNDFLRRMGYPLPRKVDIVDGDLIADARKDKNGPSKLAIRWLKEKNANNEIFCLITQNKKPGFITSQLIEYLTGFSQSKRLINKDKGIRVIQFKDRLGNSRIRFNHLRELYNAGYKLGMRDLKSK